MEKKSLLFVLFILLLSGSIIIAQEQAPPKEYNQVQNISKKIPIDQNTGQINKTFLNITETRAEKRIKAINNWIKNNTPWLRLLFGMVPQISWLFFINFLIWVWFLTAIVLNGHLVFVFLERKKAKLFGLFIFIILLVLKIFYYISKLIYNIFYAIYSYVVPYGFLALILFFVISSIFFPGLITVLIQMLLRSLKKKAAARALQKQELNRKILEKTVQSMEAKPEY